MKSIIWGLTLSAAMLAGCKSPPASPTAAPAPPAASTPTAAPVPPITRLPATAPFTDVRLVSASEPLPPGSAGNGVSQLEVVAPALPIPPPDSSSTKMSPAFGPVAPLQLNLFDAVETALRQNPDLTTLRQTEGVSVGALGVARTYPFNPFVQVNATPLQRFVDGHHGAVAHYVLVMQTLQLAHQQRHREGIGMAALNSVRWNILQAELLNVAQTERLYFTAAYQRGIRGLAHASATLNDQLLTISERQLNAGQASAADVAIIRLDNRSTNTQARLAEANYQTALLDLRRHLNIPLDYPLEVTGDLNRWQWSAATPADLLHSKCPDSPVSPVVDSRSTVADLVSSRPDVMAARSDVAVSQSSANLASASRVPDLQFGPYYQRDDVGTTFYGFRAHMEIPVWNNGKPLVRQRQAELRQRQVALEQLRNRATIEGQIAIDRYERARLIAIQSSQEFSLALPDALQKLEQQFKAGEIDVVRIFTARTSLIQNHRAHLDTLNELAQAAAQLTAATTIAPQAIVSVAP